MTVHAEALYDELTDGCTKPIRLEELVYDAAELVPGLVPTRAEMDAERARKLADKEGLELAQGLLLGQVLALPRTGRHLVDVDARADADSRSSTSTSFAGHRRRRPRPRARHAARAARRASSCVTRATSTPRTTRRSGRPRPPSTWSCSIPTIEVGVFRGGVVDHPRYAGERLFGAGINLTLPLPRADRLPVLRVRDLGYVNKIYRGLADRRRRREAVDRGGRALRDRRRLPAHCT